MSGLENMKRQILDEANHSAEEQISKARTKAEEILREAREQVEEQSAVMAKKSEDETKDYAQRIASSSEMQRKQALLQAKQEVIQEVLNKAFQKLLETYALPQEGTIYFSAADLARMPQKFEDVIEQTAQKKGGHLVVSKEPKDMDGGFVLVYGGIEENCTIRAMFHTKQDELSDVVQKILFV